MGGKLKELWNRSSQEIKSMLFQFPCTVFVTVILTLLHVIYDWNWPIMEDGIFPFLYLLCMGMFFAEAVFFEKKICKIVSLGTTSVLSAVLAYCIYTSRNYAAAEDAWLPRILIVYIAVMLISGIYFCYHKSDQAFSQYAIKVFSNLIKTHIAFVILTIGILVISEVIITLFLDDYSYDLISKLLILLVGFYYVPSWIYAVSRVKFEIEKFTKILVKFVLLPLTIALFVIIYVYVFKILLLQEIPSNQIYAIVTSLFLLAMPTWTMAESFGETSRVRTFVTKLPLCFAPLILLQVYAVVVRIMEFGVTPSRYVGLLWILLEMIYLLIYYIKRNHVGMILMIGVACITFALLMPGVNMYSVSIFSQEQILAKYHDQESLSDDMKEKIYGAYVYLSSMSDSEKYIEEKYTKEEIEEIKEFYDDYWAYDQSDEVYLYNSESVYEVDIQGFQTMTRVSYFTKYDESAPDTKNLSFWRFGTEEEIIVIDLEDVLKGYVAYGLEKQTKEYSVDISQYHLENCMIELNENQKLMIQDIYITYQIDTEIIEELEINGYLLSK